MSGNVSKNIAFNYFGGKFTWLDELYANFPKGFTHLVDVFGGSFVVSLNYHGKVIKTANEFNSEITNFFKVLRNHPEELIRRLRMTPISKAEFDNSWLLTENEIENARRFYVRVRQSFFSLGAQRKNKGWHMVKQHVNSQGGETVSKFVNGVEKLMRISALIRENFQITNYDYAKCIDLIDFDKAFFYCDPPYSKRSRKSYNDYKFEFSDQNHEDLAEKLHKIKGLAMVSGYDCSLMNSLYLDFHKTTFIPKQNNIRSGLVKECIWTNYDPNDHKNLTLF